MPSPSTLTFLRRGAGRWLAVLCLGAGLFPFAAAQAHPGAHSGNASTLLSHALQSPDHRMTGLVLLSVAAVLVASGISLWRGRAGANRRVLSGACLLAAGLIVWSVLHAGGSLST